MAEKKPKELENKENNKGFLKKYTFNIFSSIFVFLFILSISFFCYYLFTLINLNSDKINDYNKTFVKNSFKSTNTKIEAIKNNLISLSEEIKNLNKKLILFEKKINLDEFKSSDLQITSKINEIEIEISNLKNYIKYEFDSISKNNTTPISNNSNIKKSNLTKNVGFLEKSLLDGDTNNDLIFKIIKLLQPSQLEDLKKEIIFLKDNTSNKIKTIYQLKEEFKLLSNLMLEKTPANKEGFFENIFVWTSRSLHLRPLNFGNAATAQQKISKIEHALRNNDLKLAVKVFETLPNEMKNVGNTWLYQANNRLKFDNALIKIILYLKDED